MPRPTKKSPATRFTIDKREQILTDWMAGFSEEDIVKEYSTRATTLTIEDVKDIIKYQKDKTPEEMETIRMYRQKHFIDRAWGIIKSAQIEILFGLKKHKIAPGTAMNIITQMSERLQNIEGREPKGRERENIPTPLKIEDDEIVKARGRIDKLEGEEKEKKEEKKEELKTILVVKKDKLKQEIRT